LGLRAFLSRRIVTPQGIRPGAVLVDGERIKGLVAPSEVPADASREDFGDVALLPGLVDSHVHINEPGRTEWEGFNTATRAAAAGGYTMLVDMPLNCIPATTNVSALEAKRRAAQGLCRVDWAAWGGVVQDNENDIEGLAQAGVKGFKCFLVPPGIEEFSMVRESHLRAALPHVARTGLPLLVHAELPEFLRGWQARDEDGSLYSTWLRSRPAEAEVAAIELMLSLCREFGFRLHIVHLATGLAFDSLRSARADGLPVTVETCPHYLHFEADHIADGATQFKCAPPIRSGPNRERLWQGLREGIVEMVVTDHSPCPPEMKGAGKGSFHSAWGGIASLSLALPVMWTEAQKRGFSLTEIVCWMAERPAQLAGCDSRKGKIAAGYDADFVVFDPEAEFTVVPDKLYQRHPVSPYLGEKLRGRVKGTYLRGRQVFWDGEFPGDAIGREFVRN
jgi:allantoinase